MKRQSMMYVIFLMVMGLIGNVYAETESELLPVQGKSLFSFTKDHFIIQTDRYFYKVAKSGLSTDLAGKLERATLNNEDIAINIPNKNIEYVWPSEFLGTSCCWNGKSKDDYSATVSELNTEVAESNGKIQINGKLVLSMSEPYFLIQVKEAIYQIKKSALTKKQLTVFRKLSPGSPVNVSVPGNAVEYSWNFKQVASRNIASVDAPDEMSANKTYLTLAGTVLYSANEPVVIVQSKDVFYHIKRNGIITKNPKLLDINGSKIQLLVPVKDIEFFWSTNNSKLVHNGPI